MLKLFSVLSGVFDVDSFSLMFGMLCWNCDRCGSSYFIVKVGSVLMCSMCVVLVWCNCLVVSVMLLNVVCMVFR